MPEVLERIILGESEEDHREAIEKHEGADVFVCSLHERRNYYHRGILLTDIAKDGECFYLVQGDSLVFEKKDLEQNKPSEDSSEKEKQEYGVQVSKFRLKLLDLTPPQNKRIHYHDLIDVLKVLR